MEAISLFVQPKPLLSETIERIVADGTLKARALVLSRGITCSARATTCARRFT